jgi:tRNA (guanine-N7-)-methyltransferase
VVVGAHRKIRSFVRREGRITVAQKQAYAEHWQRFGIDFLGELITPDQWQELFKRSAPLVVDLGFGNGESTAALALAHPEWNIIGIEVYRPGVGNLFRQLVEKEISNVRVFCHDAVEVLQTAFPSASLQRVQIFFPDPWQKKRHHKRRLIQPEFVALIADRLQLQGELLLATDWQAYAEHMAEVLMAQTVLRSASDAVFAPRDNLRPLTKFERRGQKAGHDVWDLKFIK